MPPSINRLPLKSTAVKTEGMAMLLRIAEMISPSFITTASPVPTSVPIQRKGMLNSEKFFWLYTGKKSSENFNHSSWPVKTPVGKRNWLLIQGSSMMYLEYSSFSSMNKLRSEEELLSTRSQSMVHVICSIVSAE